MLISSMGRYAVLILLDLAEHRGGFVPVRQIAERNLVTFRYVNADGTAANGRYPLNPNGSAGDIAGICNEAGNVVGLMPHPEHAVEALTGPGTDGLGFFTSILNHLVTTGSARDLAAPAGQGAPA